MHRRILWMTTAHFWRQARATIGHGHQVLLLALAVSLALPAVVLTARVQALLAKGTMKTKLRRQWSIRVLSTFVALMSWPLIAEATPNSLVAEYVVPFGNYGQYKYTYVEGLLNGTVNRPDGTVDNYSTPVVLIYPEKRTNGFGWVDLPVTSYFVTTPNPFCTDPSTTSCPADEDGRLLEDQIVQGSRLFSEDFLFQQGYVYMSVQYNKYITDNFGTVPRPQAGGRRRLAYGTIPHGTNAYTIVQDAAQFLRNPIVVSGPDISEIEPPEAVDHVIGSGYSHAAWFARGFLIQGFNRTANGTPFYDGMIHINPGRFCRHALDVSPFIPSSGTGLTCRGVPSFQGQLDGKLITLQSETDFGPFSADQARDADPQHPGLRIYEIAGTSHIPQPVADLAWRGAVRQNPTDPRPFFRAAADHLRNWINEGTDPPASVYLDGQRTTTWVFNVDADGNTTGGIRPPSMTSTTAQGEPAGAPKGVYGGTESIPGNLGASLGGTFVPFSDEVLSQRYPTKGAYITLVVRSAFQLLGDRYILPEDVIRYIVDAGKEAP